MNRINEDPENAVPTGTDTPGKTSERLLVLEPGRAERHYWRDVWQYRELFTTLAWRDISVHYKQTVIGVAWALIRPFLTMLIFTVVFGRLAKLQSDGGAPYPILVLAGMLPWMLFSTILSEASSSIVSSANLIGKVYFPRLIVPCASAAIAMVDFGVSLMMLALIMVWYGVRPNYHVVFFPFFVVLAILASLGPALYMTALNVRYRDFRFVIPFALQLGMYLSPVGFSSAVVPARWRFLYSLNPVAGVIDGFRWCLLGGRSHLYPLSFLLNVVTIALLLWMGLSYFRKTERTFADLI